MLTLKTGVPQLLPLFTQNSVVLKAGCSNLIHKAIHNLVQQKCSTCELCELGCLLRWAYVERFESRWFASFGKPVFHETFGRSARL